MIMKYILPLLWLVALASSAGDQVRHLMIDDANLVETMQGFAMNAPILAQNNIKTVSVNGDSVVLIAPNCQPTVTTKQQIAAAPEYQDLLSSTKMQLNSADSRQPQMAYNAATRSGSARFSINNQQSASMSYGRNINFQSFNINGWAMNKYDDNNFSMRRPNLPSNINRIFVSNDVVTFVYNTGEVSMKPIACLKPTEQQLVQQLREEVHQAQLQFEQSMRQFQTNMQHNMQQMQSNLQQNMRNMQTRLQQNMQGLGSSMQNMFGSSPNSYNPYGGFSMNQMQTPGQQSQIMQNGVYSGTAGYPATSAYASAGGAGQFGPNFPFGTNNGAFWQ